MGRKRKQKRGEMTNKQYFTMIPSPNALNQIADKMAEDNWKPKRNNGY